MEIILNHVNEKLAQHHLSLDNNAVTREYQLVKEAWEDNLKSINKPIDYLIIGEATQSYENYFYNTNANTTSFLNPAHFGCKNKSDLINFFNKNGVLVFDLYPLPLSTFVYDNIKFDCSDNAYKDAMVEHFDSIKPLIHQNTNIVLRYSKLYCEKIKNGKVIIEKRCEFELLMSHLKRGITDFSEISLNISASKEKIRNMFNDIIPQ